MKKEEKTRLTRERILEAAITEFADKGYFGASINAVCKTGINKGLIYHNFRDRDELYLACVEKSLEDLTDFVRKARQEDPDITYIAARIRFFSTHEREARIFFEAVSKPPGGLEERIRQLRGKLDELNLAEFDRILSCCRLREGVTRREAYDWFQAMETAYNTMFGKGETKGEHFRETVERHENGALRFVELLLFGIAERKDEKIC